MNKFKKTTAVLTFVVSLFILSTSAAVASPKLVQTVDRGSFDYLSQNQIIHKLTANSNDIGAIAFYTTETIDASNPITFEFSLFDDDDNLLHQETRIQNVRVRVYEYFWFGFPALEKSENEQFTVHLTTDNTSLETISSFSLFIDQPISNQLQQEISPLCTEKIQEQQLFWGAYALLMLLISSLAIVKFVKKRQS